MSALALLLERDVQGRFVPVPRPDTQLRWTVGSDSRPTIADLSEGSLGLDSNRAEANVAKRAQRKAAVADEVAELARQACEQRAARMAAGGSLSAVVFSQQVLAKVATKSGNVKGTFTRALKQAADDINRGLSQPHENRGDGEAVGGEKSSPSWKALCGSLPPRGQEDGSRGRRRFFRRGHSVGFVTGPVVDPCTSGCGNLKDRSHLCDAA